MRYSVVRRDLNRDFTFLRAMAAENSVRSDGNRRNLYSRKVGLLCPGRIRVETSYAAGRIRTGSGGSRPLSAGAMRKSLLRDRRKRLGGCIEG